MPTENDRKIPSSSRLSLDFLTPFFVNTENDGEGRELILVTQSEF